MKNTLVKYCYILIAILFVSACSSTQFYHKSVMKGQVVGIEGKEAVVCIGSRDGAKPGQELQVYRYNWEPVIEEGEDRYTVEAIGTVVVKSIVDEHFAKVSITSGDVRKTDMVEQSR